MSGAWTYGNFPEGHLWDRWKGWKGVHNMNEIWVWVNTYRYIFSGMNIHLPAIWGSLGTRVLTHCHMFIIGLQSGIPITLGRPDLENRLGEANTHPLPGSRAHVVQAWPPRPFLVGRINVCSLKLVNLIGHDWDVGWIPKFRWSTLN